MFRLQNLRRGNHAELMMKRTGLPVIPGICIPQPDGNYLLRCFKALEFEPEDTEHSIAQACWDVFEPIIRENPAAWLLHKHWRFLPQDLPSGEEGRYPSYARPNAGFEEVLVRVQSTKV